MNNILKLHPHKHTGKLLHHRHTSYHALFLLLAVAGAFMVTMNHLAKAADLQVTAIIPAPLPAAPAVITTPANGSTTYSSTTVLTGTCPVSTPAIIVVAYDGTTLLGSQTCAANGTFNMPVSLDVGTHSLTTVVMNFTGQIGATSQPTIVNYVFGTAPVVPAEVIDLVPVITTTTTTITTPAPTQPATMPLKIEAESAFIVYAPGQDTIWTATLEGGTQPYAVSINWGYGNTLNVGNVHSGKQSFRHTYSPPGTYNVRVTLKDSRQNSITQMFTAISPATFRSQPAPTETRLSVVPYLYGAYLIIVLILLEIWWYHRLKHSQKPSYAPVGAKRTKRGSK